MERRKRLVVLGASLVVVFAAQVRSSEAFSDRMIISRIPGGPVFDATIDEAGGETSLSWGVPVDPFAPGTILILLTEPPGEPPGENPIFVPGTELIVSDAVLAWNPTAGINRGVLMVSDGDPLLAQIALLPAKQVIPETGELQDLSGPEFLGSISYAVLVQVQSDVVPEPGTLLLVGSGLLGLAIRSRRARRLPRSGEDS